MKLQKLIIPALFLGINVFAQNQGSLSGSFESNNQWYQNDNKTGAAAPQDKFRSNNYLNVNYTLGKFSTGLQFESYAPHALQGYAPDYKGSKIATYYARFTSDKLDITAGDFYDQFGSGLIFRSWEDRQLGVNNAIHGIRVGFTPTNDVNLKGFTGSQRVGFEQSESTLTGLDANVNVTGIISPESKHQVKLGASYLGKYEEHTFPNEDFPATVESYSGRIDYTIGNFSIGAEHAKKTNEAKVIGGTVFNEQLFDGEATQVNLGYSTRGLGVSANLRRLENIASYAEREATGNQFNLQVTNFLPSLTKQHDYGLANIYVYQAQGILLLEDNKVGEIGGQIDLYYTFKKKSAIGGKYGTKVAANFATYYGLDTEIAQDFSLYEASTFGFGEKYFHDFNIEISKKWNRKFKTNVFYMNQFYNKSIVEGGVYDNIKTHIFVLEGLLKLANKSSLRFETQYLATKQDRNDWMGATLEYNFNPRFSIYAFDLYNHGAEKGNQKVHYYNFGGSYTKGATRFNLGYGRQRGGLICVGGVCRFVPENTGLQFGLTTNF